MRLAQPLEPSVRTVSLIAVATASAVSRSDRCRAEANSASHRSFFLFSPVIAILLVGKICPACVGVAGPSRGLAIPTAGKSYSRVRRGAAGLRCVIWVTTGSLDRSPRAKGRSDEGVPVHGYGRHRRGRRLGAVRRGRPASGGRAPAAAR